MRRMLQQRLRRHKARAKLRSPAPAPGKPEGSRGLQSPSVISEADVRAEHPVIIGLISMLIGTSDLEQIQTTYRQLWIRGTQIISENSDPALRDANVLNMFAMMKRDATKTG
jgi:hypothetical protein